MDDATAGGREMSESSERKLGDWSPSGLEYDGKPVVSCNRVPDGKIFIVKASALLRFGRYWRECSWSDDVMEIDIEDEIRRRGAK